MKAHEIKPGIYWVGARDWNVRNFHGYLTQRGTTYNAFLIVDEKITLVDTVKEDFGDHLLTRIKSIVDPAKIDYVVTNHIELDHSGALPQVLEAAPNARVITSPLGKKGMANLFDIPADRIDTVKNNETLSIGKYTLNFIHMSMIHWPDSMLTYIPEAKLVCSNDAFGQHLCDSKIFSSEVSSETLFYETAKYYANIVLRYGVQVKRALEGLGSLDFDMIAPSHGMIWDNQIDLMLEKYMTWAVQKNVDKAVVIYDTMWKSTERMAREVETAFEVANIPVSMYCLGVDHYSDVIAAILEAKYVVIGSPTLNNEILPSVAAFTTYIKGLRPLHKKGFLFGSYGWTKGALKGVEAMLKDELEWDIPEPPILVRDKPTESDFEKIKTLVSSLITE